jgi:hypothetical protein
MNAPGEEIVVPWKKVLFSKHFIVLYLFALTMIFYFNYSDMIWKEYGERYIKDDELLTFMGSMAFLGLGVSKFLTATLMDYYKFKTIFIIVYILVIAQISTI